MNRPEAAPAKAEQPRSAASAVTVTESALRAAGVNRGRALRGRLSAGKGGGTLGLARPPSAKRITSRGALPRVALAARATPRER